MESRIEDEDIRMLEQAIDVIDNELPPLNAFICREVTVEQPLDIFAGRCVAVPSDVFLHWLKNVT